MLRAEMGGENSQRKVKQVFKNLKQRPGRKPNISSSVFPKPRRSDVLLGCEPRHPHALSYLFPGQTLCSSFWAGLLCLMLISLRVLLLLKSLPFPARGRMSALLLSPGDT